MRQEYHVSPQGRDMWEGSQEKPFATISRAAEKAEKGDVIVVHAGTYREWVKPKRGGSHPLNRVTFQAAAGEKVVIKGSEIVDNWSLVEGTVWKAVIPNKLFGEYNPYIQTIDGDWMIEPTGWKVHAGEVYLNGNAFYEARTLDDVKNPEVREYIVYPGDGHKEFYLNPQDTLYQWYAEVEAETTSIYANFQGADPNRELVEVNVRKCCFYPEKTGIDYITVKGFEMAHAATPWAPPTSEQYGMIGTHWSKGWIIENNIFHDSKCSAVSLGKEASTGEGLSYRYKQKSGYQHQLEAVFAGLKNGWSREKIGSHIVRNNTIYDCGQNGIVGNMGCAFSKIHGNHIYNIGIKHEFFGWEIAGIKFHAPIDTDITGNRIHHCTLGFWMDWQAQGTRISRNLLYQNDRDGNIEVTHGPLIIDNNIFASDYGFDNHAQGTAFVNNMICGRMYKVNILDRSTPYHLPHSTEVAGYSFVYGGDDRYFNNIFVGNQGKRAGNAFYGTNGYDGHTISYREFVKKAATGPGQDHENYTSVRQPVYMKHNVYLNGARAFAKETEQYTNCGFHPEILIEERADGVYLEFTMPKGITEILSENVNTEKLGDLIIADTVYDAPDGMPLLLEQDYFGNTRRRQSAPGPFDFLQEGKNRLKIW
ncbi:DUF1565 domain-containing protein [Faecalicatena contorta]|uniref:right-handed parallel beta-helix repeat-containing protein n=1 Tax=Faecalicatena contorta TaxID=39482 RepID=UPI00129D3AA9|nr:right-handed parallel beta-helix repeat-containing protein [Faecalicatena contorta]MRM88915.1 DUF1565 domain-containing protein [Faecalicatena contorta]